VGVTRLGWFASVAQYEAAVNPEFLGKTGKNCLFSNIIAHKWADEH
jgi:hypothetical protein